MKYIAKINITFALKSGNVKFVKGKEIDAKDAEDFKARTKANKGAFERYVTVEVAEKVSSPKKAEKKK